MGHSDLPINNAFSHSQYSPALQDGMQLIATIICSPIMSCHIMIPIITANSRPLLIQFRRGIQIWFTERYFNNSSHENLRERPQLILQSLKHKNPRSVAAGKEVWTGCWGVDSFSCQNDPSAWSRDNGIETQKYLFLPLPIFSVIRNEAFDEICESNHFNIIEMPKWEVKQP